MRPPDPASFALLTAHWGFVPNLFRAQVETAWLVDAEAALVEALLFRPSALSRAQKESLLLGRAAARGNRYWYTLHRGVLPLMGRAGQPDFREPVAALDATLVLALGDFLCTLASGIAPQEDFPAVQPESGELPVIDPPAAPAPSTDPEAYSDFRDHYGFVPRVYRRQAARPDALEAEARFLEALMVEGPELGRRRKELILLAVAARARNEYLCSLQAQELAVMGVPVETSDRITLDPEAAGLPESERALLAFVRAPSAGAAAGLQAAGFSHAQVMEALAAAALGDFLASLAAGLAVEPDFAVRVSFPPPAENNLHPGEADSRLKEQAPESDPDGELVDAAQRGDLAAFEQLVVRHGRRVYRTLVGILGDAEEARDLMQDTFLKAFQHLGGFERRSKFSTWLLSIASRTGIQHLRERRSDESLDSAGDDEAFRPRQVRSWIDDPEQAFARAEMRALVEKELRRLPAKYRVAVMLRDIEQLSTEEAAGALELGVPALKARLLRGRLMLREALASHFAGGAA